MAYSINDFSSIFEILAGLNLTYAVFERFRILIDEGLYRLSKTMSDHVHKKMDRLHAKIFIIFISEKNTNKFYRQFRELERNFDITFYKLRKLSEYSANFTDGLKSIFLISFLFSFSVLLLGAYEQFCPQKEGMNILLTFLNISAFFINLIFTIRNIPKRNVRKNVKPTYSILFFLIPVLLYIIYFHYQYRLFIPFPSLRLNITFAILLASSSFIFHFFRVYIHKFKYRIQFYCIAKETEKTIIKYEMKLEENF